MYGLGCICFLIYFSAEGITDHIPLMRIFFIYNPLVSLFILVSSIISLTIVLWSFDIKSMTSLLTDIVPPNLMASLFFVLVLNTFWYVFVELSRFEFTERIDVLVLFFALVHTFVITIKVLLLLTAGFSLLLRVPHWLFHVLSRLSRPFLSTGLAAFIRLILSPFFRVSRR